MADSTPTVDFTNYQALHRQWRRRNFGRALLHQPVLGVIEELCELDEAREEVALTSLQPRPLHSIESLPLQLFARTRLSEKELDAIGDILLYTMDLCSAYGWPLQDLWEDRTTATGVVVSWTRIIGKLAHHQLKAEQNIRGGVDQQEALLRGTVLFLLGSLEAFCEAHGEGPTLLIVLDNVWAAVSQRDWRAKPDTAHVGLG